MVLYERLILPENLFFAWQKAKRLYSTLDGYLDRGEIAEFELNLDASLEDIRRKFKNGKYRTSKLRVLPRPKKLTDKETVDRQYFHVSVRDQVAWIAVVNAIGPELDLSMPSWSYGNRLYRPAWYEENEEKSSKLEIGPYRHSSGHLYRKFQHSWPLFRRQVSLTSRVMVTGKPLKTEELDEAEQLALSAAEEEKLRYLEDNYWPPRSEENSDSLFVASIDLKQFFPQLRSESIKAGLSKANPSSDERITMLLNSMLEFRVDHAGIPPDLVTHVEPEFPRKFVHGLPTGLFVAGFLSNVAMKIIDYEVDQELDKNKTIAHFRFVDDHTILSYSFDELCLWIRRYQKLLKTHSIGPKVNSEKFDPPSLGKWIRKFKVNSKKNEKQKENHRNKYEKAVKDTTVDGRNPTKLMTKTLAQVSAIATDDIHVLDEHDLEERLKMLEWLLGADISEQEIRPDTKAAFAAGQIAQLAPVHIKMEVQLVNKARYLAKFKEKNRDMSVSNGERQKDYKQRLGELEKEFKEIERKQDNSEKNFYKRCYDLLIQALKDFPAKPNLFYRVLQYCRNTGYSGLAELGGWIIELRNDQKSNAADYYSGLGLQILGQNAVICARLLTTRGVLRFDQKVAKNHLLDIQKNYEKSFSIDRKPEVWFHSVAMIEFGVALLVAAQIIGRKEDQKELADKLFKVATQITNLSTDSTNEEWIARTGRSPGVWAFMFESRLDSRDGPTASWQMFSTAFQMTNKNDVKAVRWYPERMSDAAWNHFVQPKVKFSHSEAGWVYEVLKNNKSRYKDAESSSKFAFKCAAGFSISVPDKITLEDWVNQVSRLTPFDPRNGEWTAFEIIRQLLESTAEIGTDKVLRG